MWVVSLYTYFEVDFLLKRRNKVGSVCGSFKNALLLLKNIVIIMKRYYREFRVSYKKCKNLQNTFLKCF